MNPLTLIGDIFNALFKGPIYNVLILLYHATGAFALSIVLLTLLIRVCLIPLTRKQLQSSRKMQELQPQIKALQAKYRGDPQGLMQAQRELFKENNYSQMQGCLPLVIQMPLLYALFFSFELLLSPHLAVINAAIYPFIPHLTALPNTNFLWMNLAKPDPYKILPVLAGVLTFIQLRMAMPVRPKPKPGQQRDATTQATQATMYVMPLMTLVFGLNFPAGMALYWCVGTLFMCVQQYFIGGWGSLFVGIPGMERFVPEPKVLPAAIAPAGAGRVTSSAARTAGARALTAPEPQPQSSGGFRGMLKQLREQMETTQRRAAETQATREAEKKGKVVDSTATVAGDETGEGEQPFTVAPGASAAQRAQRQRQRQQGPTLVKPAYKAGEPGGAADGVNDTPAVGTSADVVDEASGGPATPAAPSAAPTPTSDAGAAKASNGASPRTAGSATQTRPSTAGQQRKPAGSGKGASSGRPRNNGRPKGGR